MSFLAKMQPRSALLFLVIGGLSFWSPDVAIHFSAGRRFDSPHVWVITFLSPATFAFAYLMARRFAIKQEFKWVGAAMLLGVWLTGGFFMMLAATASGGGFATPDGARGGLLMVIVSLFPLFVLMFATYDGSLFALLAVTAGALLVWAVRKSGMPLPFRRRAR